MSGPGPGGENWFYVREGRRIGPFDRNALIAERLTQSAPESILVWRTGLPAWAKAGSLDELRSELPPPIPGLLGAGLPDLATRDGLDPDAPASPLPPLPREGAVSDDPAGDLGPEGESEAEGAPDGTKRRRRRRQRPPSNRPLRAPRYILPLVLLFLAVMVGLWFLLRRLNEAPPGQILQQGATDCCRGASRA
jgi:hypothetical protein